MGNTAIACSDPSRHVQWKWKSGADPFSKSAPDEWGLYSDVENMIIEKAFTAGESHAILDDYHIDFKHNVQISNNDVNKQRPIKRMERGKDEKRLREERFMPNPVAPDRPFSGLYGFIPPFIKEVVKDLNLTREQLPSKDKKVVSMIVEKAALGIIKHGEMIRKRREAEEIAQQLTKRKKAGIEEVWEHCAYLYSLDSFLYRDLNEVMRLIGSADHERIWRSKVRTLGPFSLLLWDNPFDSKMATPGKILYRGAQLPDHFIASFRGDCSKDPKPVRSFQAFTSCSRNRSEAEQFGNVLFIMETRIAFTVDISSLSKYSHEEEELLFPGVCFTTDFLLFDKDKNKHLIYLTLQQRHNKADQSKLNGKSQTSMQIEQNDIDHATLFDRRAAVLRDLDDAFRLARLDDDRLDDDDRVDRALTRTGYSGDWDDN